MSKELGHKMRFFVSFCPRYCIVALDIEPASLGNEIKKQDEELAYEHLRQGAAQKTSHNRDHQR